MGIELPSFSLRLGIGVWMFAIVAKDLIEDDLFWRRGLCWTKQM